MSDNSGVWSTTKWFASGAISGMANTLAGHPFDTLKVRMQTEGTKGKFKGPLHCLKTTIVEEGVRGLYKGLAPPFWGLGIINMAMFGFFGESRKVVAKYFNKSQSQLTLSEVCIAGGITGVLVSGVVVPVEQVKARLQIQYRLAPGEKPLYTGTLDCVKKLVKNNGVFGLWRGFTSTVMTRMHCWSYFGGQEAARLYFVGSSGNQKLTNTQQFLSGGFAGMTYWTVALPFDCVKNRMMSQPDVIPRKYPTVWSCWKHIYKTDGVRGYFVGFVPAAMRTLPANGVTFLAFQLTKDMLEKMDVYFE